MILNLVIEFNVSAFEIKTSSAALQHFLLAFVDNVHELCGSIGASDRTHTHTHTHTRARARARARVSK